MWRVFKKGNFQSKKHSNAHGREKKKKAESEDKYCLQLKPKAHIEMSRQWILTSIELKLAT